MRPFKLKAFVAEAKHGERNVAIGSSLLMQWYFQHHLAMKIFQLKWVFLRSHAHFKVFSYLNIDTNDRTQ